MNLREQQYSDFKEQNIVRVTICIAMDTLQMVRPTIFNPLKACTGRKNLTAKT